MSLIQPTCSNCKYKFHENKTHCLGCYDSIREILTNHKFEETNEFYEIGKICFDIIKAVRFLNNEGFESCRGWTSFHSRTGGVRGCRSFCA